MHGPVNRGNDVRVDGGLGAAHEPAGASALAAVRGLLARVGLVLCPPRCLVCGAAGSAGEDACAACRHALPWNRRACGRCAVPLPRAAFAGAVTTVAGGAVPGAAGALCPRCRAQGCALDAIHAAFVYRFPLDRLLPRFKYHHDLAAGRQLSEWMAQALAGAPRPDALVPLPLHHDRLRARGYDQALELARPLARRLRLPLRADLLSRERATAPQARLDAAQRARNLQGAFAVAARRRPPPAHVALVDDVMTTGATLRAAADALRAAGVARVDAWVCARVP